MPNSFMFSILDLHSAIRSIFWQQDFLFFFLCHYMSELDTQVTEVIHAYHLILPQTLIFQVKKGTVTLNDLFIFLLLFGNHCLSRRSMLSICLKWRKKQEHSMEQNEHRPWGAHPAWKQFPMTINPQYFHIAWSNFPSQLLDRNRTEHVPIS